MSMLFMSGELFNIFVQPGGKNKEGDSFDARDKIQLIGDFPLENGSIKKSLVDLSVDNISLYSQLLGKVISVPVGSYVAGPKSVGFFVPKGSKPSVVSSSQTQNKPL